MLLAFALVVALGCASIAESRGHLVLGMVVLLRSHRPTKFPLARARTRHPLSLWLGVRGGFLVLLVVVSTAKNGSAFDGFAFLWCHISAVVVAHSESSLNVLSTNGGVAGRGSSRCRCLVSDKRGFLRCADFIWLVGGLAACQPCQWRMHTSGEVIAPSIERVTSIREVHTSRPG
jgi:hypothetical protein